MKKKIAFSVFATVGALVCAFGFAACGGDGGGGSNPPPHEHVFSEEWQRSEWSHWHVCTVSGCLQETERVAHDFSDGDCVCGQPAPAVKYSTAELLYSLNADGESYSVTGINESEGVPAETNELVIPTTHGGKPVTAIGDAALMDCNWFTDVTVAGSVERVGSNAFSGCGRLAGVKFLNGVKSIGQSAFFNCRSLAEVSLPDSVKDVGPQAFSYCGGLVYAEYGNAKYLGNAGNPYVALIEATSKEIVLCTVNENAKCIAANAFMQCGSLTEISIPRGVAAIGETAFGWCEKLASVNFLQNSELTGLGLGAFMQCGSLESFIIPQGVKTIGDRAFQWCGRLASVTIPSSMNYIGAGAFNECYVLADLKFNGLKAQWDGIEKGQDWDRTLGDYVITFSDGSTAGKN